MNQFVLTDEAITRALRPEADVVAPDGFTSAVMAAVPTARRRGARLAVPWSIWPRPTALLFQMLLLALLLALVLAVALAIGSLPRRSYENGPVLLVRNGQLEAVDPTDPVETRLSDETVFNVGRSADGRFVSYWTSEPEGLQLWLADAAVTTPRRVLPNFSDDVFNPTSTLFSADGAWMIGDVTVGNEHRILEVNSVSGEARLVGLPGEGGAVISPDGELIAYVQDHDSSGPPTVEVMNRDGSSGRAVTTGAGIYPHGVDSWSPDQAFLYFGADIPAASAPDGQATNSVYRVNVTDGHTEKLSGGLIADAPSLTPDGTLLTFIVWSVFGDPHPDLWIMESNNPASAHLLLADADIRGWANDSQKVLAETDDDSFRSSLTLIDVKTSQRRDLIAVDDCFDPPCFSDLSWGNPRP